MTKKHFIRAAEIVRAILAGEWTQEFPSWVVTHRNMTQASDHVRAIQTAEAFIILAQAFNPRFDTARFLVACGLATKPVKATKGKRTS